MTYDGELEFLIIVEVVAEVVEGAQFFMRTLTRNKELTCSISPGG